MQKLRAQSLPSSHSRYGFTAAHGDRADYPDIMVILTDGHDDSDVAKYQRQAASRNITVIAV